MGSLSTNPRNTISQLKRMMGKKFSDPSVQQDLQYFPFVVTEGPAGECLFNVQYLDKLALFTAEQLMAMLLVDLKAIAEAEGSPVSECVLSVPVYYTEPERNAMLAAAQVGGMRVGGAGGGRGEEGVSGDHQHRGDSRSWRAGILPVGPSPHCCVHSRCAAVAAAAPCSLLQIAGLNCLRLLNETTATALAYGIYKTDLPEGDPVNVVFVDIGFASTQVRCVVQCVGAVSTVCVVWCAVL